ncbi:cation-binding protein [Hanstruepera neustonica]|uniref:Cation-binding protein n=1 Tax=Hanstruepera neustonica TaxID=1445657 RepID=A0A2K1DWS6_9FLAO|nr:MULTISPECIES: hemerythrin domain-containing protein [Hanstruepera]PNQ72478.1 cation-binding protein [Hanstruepera neustonica]
MKSPNKPLKRHTALQPLSKEHHHGLLLCWKIRTGFSKKITPERIWAYANWFYKTHLIPHFKIEEEYIFTILNSDNKLVIEAIEQHRELQMLFTESDKNTQTLSTIELLLEKHIRFEERVLFPKIQNVATEKQFETIEALHNDEKFIDKEDDVFWK